MFSGGTWRPARPAARTRFTKSYKYKHKLGPEMNASEASCEGKSICCDMQTRATNPPPRRSISASASADALIRARLIALAAAVNLIFLLLGPVAAFCPFKCACNDAELTANCTQVGAISTVPMTLNPLLKRLTLNQLPIGELSNSLALYRQLDYLNLNANQLRQVKYENFNFNAAPKTVQLGAASGQRGRPGGQSEAHARHLKHSLEKQLNLASDEIRFHLRELHLAGNKIEQLGEQQPTSAAEPESELQRSLKGHELERLAPFLGLSKLELLELSGNKLKRLQQHAFLGLLRLRRLDLSHNQLEFVDRHALVGLLALEELNLSGNKLARHQQQLSSLGQLLCMGPLMELRQLDLSANGVPNSAQELAMQLDSQLQHQRLVLPNQMFVCAPKLTRLNLRALRLRYIQVEAFEGLSQLQSLDLSENLFEQVPINTLRAARAASQLEAAPSELQMSDAANQLASLRELKLSKNPIEFVNANSFENLKQLLKLEMGQMPQLVSFDLASLITSLPNGNANLEELRLSQNQRLQGLRSSARLPIKFPKLRLLDLRGSSELREVHLDQMVDLGATSGRPLEVDISDSNNLNCSSCRLNWLIEAFKQRGPLAPAARLQPSALPASGSPSGWAPIPFDPYNSFAPAAHFGLPAGGRPPLALLNSDLINCAWPFSMSLIELINLETNYAPLFAHACPPTPAAAAADANRKSTQSNSTLLQAANEVQFLSQHQRAGSRNLMSGSSSGASKQPHEQTNVALGATQSEGSSAPAAYALIGLLLVSVTLLLLLARLRALVAQRRKLHLNCSPSFTATTSIESPSSSAGGSSASGRHRAELVANPLAREPPVSETSAAGSYYYFAPALVQRPPAPKASAVFQNGPPPPPPHSRHDPTIGARLSSALTDSSKMGARRAADHARPNLFSRFAGRLSGDARREPAPEFAGIGTTLRFHGGRVPCGPLDLGQQARFSAAGRANSDLTRPPPEQARAAAGTQLIYAHRLAPGAQVEAAFEAPSVANHYSICGDVNEEPAAAAAAAAYQAGPAHIGHATFAQVHTREPPPEAAPGGVSPRKNKRRRRRLDDNHTNGHLNQLHARHDYNQLEGASRPAAPEDEAEFIYANS